MFKKPINKNYLKPQPIQDLSAGDNTWFVETPEQEVMYFTTKKEANKFVQFYYEYCENNPDAY